MQLLQHDPVTQDNKNVTACLMKNIIRDGLKAAWKLSECGFAIHKITEALLWDLLTVCKLWITLLGVELDKKGLKVMWRSLVKKSWGMKFTKPVEQLTFGSRTMNGLITSLAQNYKMPPPSREKVIINYIVSVILMLSSFVFLYKEQNICQILLMQHLISNGTKQVTS